MKEFDMGVTLRSASSNAVAVANQKDLTGPTPDAAGLGVASRVSPDEVLDLSAIHRFRLGRHCVVTGQESTSTAARLPK
jgi:hypothetical protein